MRFAARRVPEERGFPAELVVLEMDPARVWPALSAQPEWNHSQGVIRGRKQNGVLLEDHVVLEDGRRVEGSQSMRERVWTFERHLAAYRALHPHDGIAGWACNGNLLSNPHFVGYAAPVVYCLAGEERHFASRRYTCLVVRRAGAEPRVSIESLRFPELPGDIESATFGQRLVEGGEPLELERLVALARDGQFYDLRHLFLFGRIRLTEERWIDAGLAAFWDDRGCLDVAAVEAALRGRPVAVDVSQFEEAAVHAALAAKGYRDYSLRNGWLRLALQEGIYPHSMIGIRADGTVVWAGVRGLSNRVGLTVRDAAGIMAELGCRDALLIDNGADVALSVNGRMALGGAGRDRSRSLLILRSGGPLAAPSHYAMI